MLSFSQLSLNGAWMKRHILTGMALAAIFASHGPSVWAQQQSTTRGADPIIGSWKLDIAQSTFKPRDAAPIEHIEVYRELSTGRIEFTLTRTRTADSPTIFKATWPAEGGIVDQVSPSPGFSTVETVIAPGDWWVTQMRDGKQYATIHKVVSKDAKTMRQTVKGTNSQGIPVEHTQVFTRQ
jgi:hypothetical protein